MNESVCNQSEFVARMPPDDGEIDYNDKLREGLHQISSSVLHMRYRLSHAVSDPGNHVSDSRFDVTLIPDSGLSWTR